MPSRPPVFATASLPGSAFESLSDRVELDLWTGTAPPDADELRKRSSAASGLLCTLADPISASLLAESPSLRVISSCSVGVDHVDLAAATGAGVPVGHTPGVLVETTADLAFALLLAAARRLGEAERYVRSGSWKPGQAWDPSLLLGRDLSGGTLGVIGLGAIGQAVARRAQGFGMRVLGWNRSPREVEGVESVSLEELLASADFLSVHVALNEDTRNLIDARAIAAMKPGAILVNTARGGIVDESALAAALREGRLAGAGLDVFENEPLASDSPLLQLDNVVLAPHIGSASVRTRERMTELAVANLLAGLAGETLPHCANPEVYSGS